MGNVHLYLDSAATVQRGCIFTASDSFLTPNEASSVQVDGHLGALRTLTRDNPTQRAHLDSLEPLVARKLRNIEEVAEGRARSGFRAAQARVDSREGLILMERIAAGLRDMRRE